MIPLRECSRLGKHNALTPNLRVRHVLTCAFGSFAWAFSFTSESMQLLSEFRYPTRWYSKLIAALLALVFFTLDGGRNHFRIRGLQHREPHPGAEIDRFGQLSGPSEDVSYSVGGVATRDGWFFPGLKSAPTILLCPGYRVGREELLPLATALQDHQYNVFLFDFGRHRIDTRAARRSVFARCRNCARPFPW